MKILALQGSPKKQGNTETLLQNYLKGVKEKYGEVVNEEIFLAEKNIKLCRGCGQCKKSQTGCVIQDDMQQLCEKMKAADVIIFATPIYWWNITSYLKVFLDRMYQLNFETDLVGKKAVLLMTFAGEQPNSGLEYVKNIFTDICDYVHMELVQSYGVCTGSVSVAENSRAREEVYKLGKEL